jgi:hypothetical protein
MDEKRPRAARNSKLTAPATIDEARKMARIRAVHAAPLWGMTEGELRRRCIREEIPGATQPGKGSVWYVTPAGMDAYFEKPAKKARK